MLGSGHHLPHHLPDHQLRVERKSIPYGSSPNKMHLHLADCSCSRHTPIGPFILQTQNINYWIDEMQLHLPPPQKSLPRELTGPTGWLFQITTWKPRRTLQHTPLSDRFSLQSIPPHPHLLLAAASLASHHPRCQPHSSSLHHRSSPRGHRR